MNDAVGTQTQTIFVRLSALEKINLLKTLIFELKISLLVATPIAVGIFIFTAIWLGSTIGEIVGLSMFLGMLSSALIATLIPWTLERLGKDPAIGSGPFTTIIQDLLSIIIYFKVASILL
jgi:magnesium transporter